jgi:type IV secretion system protein VirB6
MNRLTWLIILLINLIMVNYADAATCANANNRGKLTKDNYLKCLSEYKDVNCNSTDADDVLATQKMFDHASSPRGLHCRGAGWGKTINDNPRMMTSCINVSSIFDVASDIISTIGISEWIANDFSMRNPAAEGEIIRQKDSFGRDTNILITKCQEKSNKIKFCYTPSFLGDNNTQGACKDSLYELCVPEFGASCGSTPSQITVAGIVQLRAAHKADMLCVEMFLPTGWQTLGCKYRKITPSSGKYEASCFISPSCFDGAYVESFSLFPMSSIVIQCLKESITKIFQDTSHCANDQGRTNLFPKFQKNMRSIVMALLTLYVMFYGMKVALGKEAPNKGEFFMFIIKFVLVLYFSVGIPTNLRDNQGDIIYRHGVTDLYNGIIGASTSLGQIFLPVSPNNPCPGSFGTVSEANLCSYSPKCYKKGYEYLALWDSLDCRITYYLGMGAMDSTIDNGVDNIFTNLLTNILRSSISIIFPLFTGFQLLLAFLMLAFVITLISITVYVVQLYLTSMLMIALVTFIAPIFVPLALFNQTKEMFKAWLKQLIGFALQPVIVTAFIGLMLVMFDQVYFTDCKFNMFTVEVPVINKTIFDSESGRLTNMKKVPFFGLKTKTATEECKRSVGYQLLSITSGNSALKSVKGFFFDYTVFNPSALEMGLHAFTIGMLKVAIFGFLFYFFAAMVGGLAADLVGGTNLSMGTIGANAVTDKAIDLGFKAAQAAIKIADTFVTGGTASAAANIAVTAARKVGEEVKDNVSDAIEDSRKGGENNPSPESGVKVENQSKTDTQTDTKTEVKEESSSGGGESGGDSGGNSGGTP